MCSPAGRAWSRAQSLPGAQVLGTAPCPPLPPSPCGAGQPPGRLKNQSWCSGRCRFEQDPASLRLTLTSLETPRSHGQQGLAGPEAASGGGGSGSCHGPGGQVYPGNHRQDC
ncbi:adipogenesis regulatory factor isoform X1 [Phacochoerus africanus]|uniref:adipogenesis regulatory factor isoform X1 n=1 Tax=Phacochoerus africanus TaxID=41426 RepID=UPI001FD9521E|nr:adipogenesis regulatory factor isoform X1 [Phacochoerus africanus]